MKTIALMVQQVEGKTREMHGLQVYRPPEKTGVIHERKCSKIAVFKQFYWYNYVKLVTFIPSY